MDPIYKILENFNSVSEQAVEENGPISLAAMEKFWQNMNQIYKLTKESFNLIPDELTDIKQQARQNWGFWIIASLNDEFPGPKYRSGNDHLWTMEDTFDRLGNAWNKANRPEDYEYDEYNDKEV